jgi:hypothetical protein
MDVTVQRAVRTLVVLASLTVAGQRELGAQDTGAPRNPLQGLTRPTVPRVSVHDTVFCSEAARQGWLAGVVLPQLQQVDRAISALREYGDNVSVRLAALEHYPPIDTQADNALKAESKWADSALDQLEKEKSALLAAARNAKVIDCGSHVAAPRDSTRRSPTTGLTRPDVRYLNLRDTVFCTDAERRAWLAAVVLSVLQQIDRAISAVNAYDDDVSIRLAAAEHYQPVDAGDVNTLKGESRWARDKLDELEKAKKATLEKAKNAKVIDCGAHSAVPRDSVPRDSVPPPTKDSVPSPKPAAPRTGMLPRNGRPPDGPYVALIGGISDYFRFHATESNAPRLTSSAATQTVGDYGFSIGWRRKHWDVRGTYRADSRNYSQTFSSAGSSQSFQAKLDDVFYQADLAYAFGWRDFSLEGIAGLTKAIDHLKEYASSFNAAEETRTLSTYKTGFGFGIEHRLYGSFSVGLEDRCTTGWSLHDSDLSNRVGFELKYSFK